MSKEPPIIGRIIYSEIKEIDGVVIDGSRLKVKILFALKVEE